MKGEEFMSFLEQIIERAKSDVKTIVLPESTDLRVIKAASMIVKKGIAKVVLIGNEKRLRVWRGILILKE